LGLARPDRSDAVDALDAAGATVRVVIWPDEIDATPFHSKRDLAHGAETLPVYSGSGNLTGGLLTNVPELPR
jgi:hypothetical protein